MCLLAQWEAAHRISVASVLPVRNYVRSWLSQVMFVDTTTLLTVRYMGKAKRPSQTPIAWLNPKFWESAAVVLGCMLSLAPHITSNSRWRVKWISRALEGPIMSHPQPRSLPFLWWEYLLIYIDAHLIVRDSKHLAILRIWSMSTRPSNFAPIVILNAVKCKNVSGVGRW